jgi:hypothetical protein
VERKLLQGEALQKRVVELGVSTVGEMKSYGVRPAADEATLQERVLRVEEQRRQDRLWIVAVVSSAAAVISSLTALAALFWHR